LLALTDENKVAAIRAANGTLTSWIQPNKHGLGILQRVLSIRRGL